MNFHYYKMGDR